MNEGIKRDLRKGLRAALAAAGVMAAGAVAVGVSGIGEGTKKEPKPAAAGDPVAGDKNAEKPKAAKGEVTAKTLAGKTKDGNFPVGSIYRKGKIERMSQIEAERIQIRGRAASGQSAAGDAEREIQLAREYQQLETSTAKPVANTESAQATAKTDEGSPLPLPGDPPRGRRVEPRARVQIPAPDAARKIQDRAPGAADNSPGSTAADPKFSNSTYLYRTPPRTDALGVKDAGGGTGDKQPGTSVKPPEAPKEKPRISIPAPEAPSAPPSEQIPAPGSTEPAPASKEPSQAPPSQRIPAPSESPRSSKERIDPSKLPWNWKIE